MLFIGIFINIQLSTDTSAITNLSAKNQVPIALETQLTDPQTLIGAKNFYTGYPALIDNNLINAVIEIPAGQNAKWEVSENDGKMYWEIKKGKSRIVSYLPYPFNYGMIPSTLQSTDTDGDGDPIDILILGPSLPRGSIIKTKIIGVLRLKDDGERDDKLIGIPEQGPFKNVDSIEILKEKFPGVLNIIETWLTNYKGVGIIVSNGFRTKDVAQKLLKEAIHGFNNRRH
jgi:inorganic pyrophosphatase